MKIKRSTAKARPKLAKLPRSKIFDSLDTSKPITRTMATWLATHPDLIFSPETIEFGHQIMQGWAQPRDRSRSWNASDLGKCQRKQIFARLAAQPDELVDIDIDKINLFHDGHFRHLRWQMRLYDAGLIHTAEQTWHGSFVFPVAGTPDGIGADFGVEIKGANERTWRYVTGYQGPLNEHKLQAACYVILAREMELGLDRWSFIYEAKGDGQQWVEFVYEPTDVDIGKAIGMVNALETAWNDQEMPTRLPEYPDKAPCKQCPFKADCGKISDGGWIDDLVPAKPRRKIRIVRS